MKKKYKIVIDRSKWRTGEYSSNATGMGEDTALLNEQGCKCCLGFITQQITKKGILNSYQPRDCEFSIPLLNYKDGTCYENTELSRDAMAINDSHIPLKEKEVALKKLFKDTPISLTFKGKAVPYNE
jgi:hypothetical protein